MKMLERKIEHKTGGCDPSEGESEEGDFWLVHAGTQCEESDDGKTHTREGTDLSWDSIEPIEGIHGESEPEDGEETTKKREGSGRN